MNKHADCPYCENIINRSSKYEYDKVIYESQNFVVTPTKGALVPGWLLLIPKLHISSFSQMSNELLSDFNRTLDYCSTLLDSQFGPVTIFENGSNVKNDLIGCGVNHAHLHLVSLPFSLTEKINTDEEIDYFSKTNTDNLGKFILGLDKSKSYLLIKEYLSDSVMISYPENKESQYLRKKIAEQLGIEDKYDYKQFDFIENVFLLLNKLSKYNIKVA